MRREVFGPPGGTRGRKAALLDAKNAKEGAKGAKDLVRVNQLIPYAADCDQCDR